jgi:predicted component of type VI protein secretion system
MRMFILISFLLLLSACASQPGVKQNQVQQMKADLDAAKNTIAQLRVSEAELKKELAEKNRVIGVLGTEKTSRVQESSELRGQVRRFVQNQIDAHKNFMVQGGLLDYLGGELVERANVEQKPLQIVDLANAIPRAGTLTGVGAHFVKPGYFSVKVLRKVENNLVVIWDSKPLLITQEGINRVNFPVSVGVEKGDVIGYYFGEGVAVSFDEGTGDTRFQTSELGLGATTSANNLQGEKKRRAYSVGVYGLLN